METRSGESPRYQSPLTLNIPRTGPSLGEVLGAIMGWLMVVFLLLTINETAKQTDRKLAQFQISLEQYNEAVNETVKKRLGLNVEIARKLGMTEEQIDEALSRTDALGDPDGN